MDEAAGDTEPTDSLLNIYSYDEYKVNEAKAKQRASVLWLISKAYENQIPNDLREPYYRDYEEQDRLKPQIIHGLSTAALYCSALSNIYADPNYHNLDHHGILQVLMRKGIYVLEPSDSALTETVLVQTAPIRMSAHMAVIDGIMSLYIKEVLIPEKVMEVVSRFSTVSPEHEMPADAEDAAILWINKCCVKLRHRIEEELGSFLSPDDSDYRQVQRVPNVPVIQELTDLNDGCCFAAVLSFYCPEYFPWQEISFNEPISLADSLYNIQLIQRFCNEHLPRDICFLTLEDFLYMHHTIRQNMLCLIADLMFVFEIQPAKGVVRPGVREDLEPKMIADVPRRHSHNGRDLIHKSHVFHHNVSPIPDLRSSSYGGSSCSLPDMHRTSPRVNGVKERAERGGSSRKHNQRSPTSPNSTLRRTHSVSLPESDQHHTKDYRDVTPPKPVQDEPRSRSDEDEEIASYFASRDDTSEVSHAPLEPLFPAKVKHSKEKNNHDTKVQERGEDRMRRLLRSGSQTDVPSYSNPPKRVGSFSDLSHRSEERRKVDDDYSAGRFVTTSNLSYSKSISTSSGVVADQNSSLQGLRSDESSRLSAGLEDYYNQLGQESGISMSTSTKGLGYRNDKLISELEDYLEEKAILESIDPYERKEFVGMKQADDFQTTSFAQLSKVKENPNPTINIVYMQHEGGKGNLKPSLQQKPKDKTQPSERHTSFAALPNTTTWQQQQQQQTDQKSPEQQSSPQNDDASKAPIAAQLCNVRLKLEERRRKIEHEKRKMESLWKKQRQKLGKTAFLQAIAKGGGASMTSDGVDVTDATVRQISNGGGPLPEHPPMLRQLSFKDIEDDLDTVKRKWLDSQISPEKISEESSPSSDSVEGVNMEELQNSIEQFNTSLSDIQADIFRLSQKQAAIQEIGSRRSSRAEDESKNFFLHSPPENAQAQNYQQNFPMEEPPVAPRRAQWGEQVQAQRVNHMFGQQQQQQQQPQVNSQMNVNISPRRSQWGHPAGHDPYMGNAPAQWHPSMRPASVEPQMMSGHMGMHHHPHYEQRPPSAVPFMDQRSQGFSLHNVPPDNYGYQYQQSQPTVYQNGPMEGMVPQYDYRTYGGGVQPHNHYDSARYPGMPYPSPPQHQQQQQPFRINHEMMNEQQMQSDAYHMQRQQQQMMDREGPPQQLRQQVSGMEQFNRRQMVPPKEQQQQIQQPPVMHSEEKHFQPILHHEYGRSTNQQVMEQPSSPPSKPVIGRTFRVPKTKLGSSPPKEPPHFVQREVSPRGTSEAPFASNTNEKDTGFYISFDDDQPKKPKPKLRPRMMKAHQQLRANSKEGGALQMTNEEGSTSSGPSSTENQEVPVVPSQRRISQSNSSASSGVGFVIGADLVNPDPIENLQDAETEMARRKEMIMIMSLRRREEQEAQRIAKEQEYAMKREQERNKRDYQEKKREEEKMRRQSILEHYLQKKVLQELEQQGGGGNMPSKDVSNNRTGTLTKSKLRSNSATRPRPKSMHVTSTNSNPSNETSLDQMSRASRLSLAGLDCQDDKDSLFSVGSFSQRTLSPTQAQHHQLLSPTQSTPFSVRHYLPPGLGRHTGPPSDGASDAGSTTSSAFTSEYTGPKLFVKPTAKSNRGIIVNAINTVLAGAVNSDTKKKVLEEINRSDSKHFLILFRDSGCQFRALYSYNPEREEVFKLYGIGPKAINDSMMDRFYKYNSGAKCFSQVHTKHLTVTIDAFTIQNILWSGKKAAPPKKDLF